MCFNIVFIIQSGIDIDSLPYPRQRGGFVFFETWFL